MAEPPLSVGRLQLSITDRVPGLASSPSDEIGSGAVAPGVKTRICSVASLFGWLPRNDKALPAAIRIPSV